MDYSEQIARLCQTNEYLKAGHRVQAIESALPVLALLNQQLLDSIRTAKFLNPKFKRLYVTRQEYWTVLVAQGLINTSLESVVTLGWNKRFDDDSDYRTLLGSLVRSGKRYGDHDHQPDVLSIRALAALATLASGKIRKSNDFDLIVAVPSSSGSTNGLPATVSRLVGERLHCECASPGALTYIRATRKMKDIDSGLDKLAEIRGSMVADPDLFRGRIVFVIDDMLESGATLRETARALRTGGAKEVRALTLAKTRKFARETMNPPCQ